ncbi:MAG: hypothetical protein F4118_11285 [Acidimicrobiaceae bacterium]|nr:hypothetical protein [Acidimicrobiaceae bacterium]
MRGNEPSWTERAGLKIVRGVVDVARYKRLVPSGKSGEKTPDWRVWLAEGRKADVEVTRCTDEGIRAFKAALEPKGRSGRWTDSRLSYEWTISITDHGPKKEDRFLRDLRKAICDVLISVEGQGGPPAQMEAAARDGIATSLQIACLCGDSRYIFVLKPPRHIGEGGGVVRTFGVAPQSSFVVPDVLVPLIQGCIEDKAPQLANAPCLKWLAVMLDGIAASVFNEFFGPDSRSPRPRLEGLSLDGIDEVWAFTAGPENYAVLRISEGGARQQHHVVSLAEPAISG